MSAGTYRWNAEDYARHSTAQFGWARELIAKLCLRGDERVLDIGCGEGKVSVELAALLPHGAVVAVDSSPEMIDLAERNNPPSRFPNLRFRCMDARELSFPDPFDVAFSNAALHWVREQSAVLEGVRRSLRPSGRVLFQLAGKGNAGQMVPVFLEVVSLDRWRDFFRELSFPYSFFDPEEYRGFLERAGLEPVRVELLHKEMEQPGREALAGWIRTTWLPFTERVPPDLREEFVSALVERFVENHPPDGRGWLRLEMRRLEVEARRP